MNLLSPDFDSHIIAAAKCLREALNDGGERDIPNRYIDKFCEVVANSMWRGVFGAIASFELYGDVGGFEFNLGGYIDTYYETDNIRWRGFSNEQVDRLHNAYPDIVHSFKTIGLEIIEHYLRRMAQSDIERAVKNFSIPSGQRPSGISRNMEYIAYECKDGRRGAEDIYNCFLERVKELMNHNENEE